MNKTIRPASILKESLIELLKIAKRNFERDLAALQKYGQHLSTCPVQSWSPTSKQNACTCGLDQIVDRVQKDIQEIGEPK